MSVVSMAYPIDSNDFIQRNHSDISADTARINQFTRNALALISKSDKTDEIKANIDSAEYICIENNIEFPSLLHLARAEYFLLINDYRSASQDATIALKKSKTNNEDIIQIKTLNFFGRYSLHSGFLHESIEYFNNSITLAKKAGIKRYIPYNYRGIANVYNALGNIKEFGNSMKLMIESADEENDTLAMEIGYYLLGTSLTDKERDFNAADSLLKKCLELAMIKKDSAYISLSLANLGWNLYREKKYEQAINSYNKSLTYSIPSGRFADAANALGNLGTIYRDLGNTEKSIYYYKKSIDQAELVDDIYNLSWVYQDMSEMYLRKRDTSNAYKTFVLFKKYSDANIKKTSMQGLTDARIRYEADAHNKEVELLSLKLKNQRLMIYGSTGLLVLTLAIGILIISRSRINAKRRISEMNRKISEVTQANLRQQMNPHFIFNTLNSIQYYMYQHDKLATNNYLTKFSSLMRKVLENSRYTSVPLRDELDALKLYLELEMIRFKDKFDYEIIVDDEIDTLLYKVPTMLIQPYVENSISHGLMPGECKGKVKIGLKLEKDYISCTIEDNGIGREAAREKNLKKDKNHNSLGTQIVASRLDLVNALYGTSLKTIYTDLKNKNGEPSGTLVEIQIPILS
jgi:tetratricopeptide (TPR) repeat protein